MDKLLKYGYALCFVFLLSNCTKNENGQMSPPVTPGPSAVVIQDTLNGEPIVVIGSERLNYVVSFFRTFKNQTLTFSANGTLFPNVLGDNLGNTWNIFGQCVSGPDIGERLTPTHSFMGYWFVFGAIYPGTDIHGTTPFDPGISPNPPPYNWNIPTDHVHAGSLFDAIKSHDTPITEKYDFRDYPNDEFFVKDEDLIVGVKIGNTYRAYPHALLNYHEIINDVVDGIPISVIYGPLSGTACVWERTIDYIGETTFGVSGFVYNNNILSFDRTTESLWSQLKSECVNGTLIGKKPVLVPYIETKWSTWKSLELNPTYISDETGVNNDYGSFPLGDYRTNHDFIPYPLIYVDSRLPAKERVHHIEVNGKSRVYRLTAF